ncbi:THAP domain-containing protein 9 [Trachymyrmex septentrionalis]|uniref:THAP domain-containing protein 9 n=1 Tax=Trachymyrmex septentrionalis TaxID=34720 RepID=A0A195FNP5_9HYME|nr:THAP domain-containing protein 9 [Trachymyrmex septentrionalis]
MLILKNEFEGLLYLLQNKISNKNKSTFGKRDEIKKFAVTLYYYSPKTYNYCRTILSLPHESSLRNWAQSVNAEPGFQQDVFKSLCTLNLEAKDCNLVFDSMTIRRDIIWNPSSHEYKKKIL